MNVCIIRQMSNDTIVGIVECPVQDWTGVQKILEDWCHMMGLSETAHSKYGIGVYGVTPHSKLLDARKPIHDG